MGGSSRSAPTDDLNVLSGCFYTTLVGFLTGVYQHKCHSEVSIILNFTCVVFTVNLSVNSDVVITDVCHETSSLVTCVKCYRQFNGKWVLNFLARGGVCHLLLRILVMWWE